MGLTVGYLLFLLLIMYMTNLCTGYFVHSVAGGLLTNSISLLKRAISPLKGKVDARKEWHAKITMTEEWKKQSKLQLCFCWSWGMNCLVTGQRLYSRTQVVSPIKYPWQVSVFIFLLLQGKKTVVNEWLTHMNPSVHQLC
jgi:hypothetical protein